MRYLLHALWFFILGQAALACPPGTENYSCPELKDKVDESWDKHDLQRARELRYAFKICFPSYEKQLLWARNAANVGTAKDIYELAIFLGINPRSLTDKKAALEQLHVAAQRGYTVAQYAYANKLIQSNKTIEQNSLDWLELAARNGYILAAQQLGRIFQSDTNLSSPEKALAWYAVADCTGGANADLRLTNPTKDLISKMNAVQIKNAQLVFSDIAESLSSREGWCSSSGLFYLSDN